MANIEQILEQAARTVAVDCKRDADQLRLDLENWFAYSKTIAQAPDESAPEIAAKIGAIEVTTDFARSALNRAYKYVPKNGDSYICPICWAKEAIKIRLRAGTDSQWPSLDCPECKAPFPVTASGYSSSTIFPV